MEPSSYTIPGSNVFVGGLKSDGTVSSPILCCLDILSHEEWNRHPWGNIHSICGTTCNSKLNGWRGMSVRRKKLRRAHKLQQGHKAWWRLDSGEPPLDVGVTWRGIQHGANGVWWGMGHYPSLQQRRAGAQQAPTVDRGRGKLGSGWVTTDSRAYKARLPPAWARAERALEGEGGAVGADRAEGCKKQT